MLSLSHRETIVTHAAPADQPRAHAKAIAVNGFGPEPRRNGADIGQALLTGVLAIYPLIGSAAVIIAALLLAGGDRFS